MTQNTPEYFGEQISLHLDMLTLKIFEAQFAAQPHLSVVYNDEQKEKCQDDVRVNLNFLASSLKVANVGIYKNYMIWLAQLMSNIHIEPAIMEAHFLLTQKVLIDFFGPDTETILSVYIQTGLESYLKTELSKRTNMSWTENVESKNLLSQLLKYEKNEAVRYVLQQAEEGIPLEKIYLETLQPVLYEIGQLWQE